MSLPPSGAQSHGGVIVLLFQPEAAEQVLRDLHPVVRHEARQSVSGAKSSASACAGLRKASLRSSGADQRGLGVRRALRRRRHAAKGDAGLA